MARLFKICLNLNEFVNLVFRCDIFLLLMVKNYLLHIIKLANFNFQDLELYLIIFLYLI
jgi:hypothetical protein